MLIAPSKSCCIGSVSKHSNTISSKYSQLTVSYTSFCLKQINDKLAHPSIESESEEHKFFNKQFSQFLFLVKNLNAELFIIEVVLTYSVINAHCYSNRITYHFINASGYGRSWTEAQRYANLWEKKGLLVIGKKCRCRCGKGQLHKDMHYKVVL